MRTLNKMAYAISYFLSTNSCKQAAEPSGTNYTNFFRIIDAVLRVSPFFKKAVKQLSRSALPLACKNSWTRNIIAKQLVNFNS